MAGTKTCPKCGGRMGQGFLLDEADGGIKKAARWVEGQIEKGWFGAVKVRGRTLLKVQTYRCDRCAYLESYAPEA